MTFWFGTHPVPNGGIDMAVRRAANAGFSTLQLFTTIPQYYGDKNTIKPERVERFRVACREKGIDPARVVSHGAYVLNVATPDTEKWTRARDGLAKELERCTALGIGTVIVPVIGSLIVGLMARFGSDKIRGHGIPEAIEAILYGESRLSLKVAFLKPISSAISIGSGGPFGAEGPIIMTGGAIGSLFAQRFHLTRSGAQDTPRGRRGRGHDRHLQYAAGCRPAGHRGAVV